MTRVLFVFRMNKLDDAVKSFSRSLELDNFFLSGIIGRGNVYMDFGSEVGQKRARLEQFSDVMFL